MKSIAARVISTFTVFIALLSYLVASAGDAPVAITDWRAVKNKEPGLSVKVDGRNSESDAPIVSMESDGTSDGFIDALSSMIPVDGGDSIFTLTIGGTGSIYVYLHLFNANGEGVDAPVQYAPVFRTSGRTLIASVLLDGLTDKKLSFNLSKDVKSVQLRLRVSCVAGKTASASVKSVKLGCEPLDAASLKSNLEGLARIRRPVADVFSSQAPAVEYRRRNFIRGERVSILNKTISCDFRLTSCGRIVKEVKANPGEAVTIDTKFLASGDYAVSTRDGEPFYGFSVRPDAFLDDYLFGLYGFTTYRKPFKDVLDGNELEETIKDIKGHNVSCLGICLENPGMPNPVHREVFIAHCLDLCAKYGINPVYKTGRYYYNPAVSANPDCRIMDSDGNHVKIYSQFISSFSAKETGVFTSRRISEDAMLIAPWPFHRLILFDDDVVMFRAFNNEGALGDYSPASTGKFKSLKGLDAPRRTSGELSKVKGVVGASDPWLHWMRFRAAELGSSRACVAKLLHERLGRGADRRTLRTGVMPAGGAWDMGTALVPEYTFGGVDCASYYYYPAGDYLLHVFQSELAYMGGADKPLWGVVRSYSPKGREFTTVQAVRQQFFALLSEGAQMVSYFTYSLPEGAFDAVPAKKGAWEEIGNLGLNVRTYGPVYKELRRKEGRLGLLMSASTCAYEVFGGDHYQASCETFLTLLRTHLPVTMLSEENVLSGRLKKGMDGVVLSGVRVLPAPVACALEEFAKSGGKVWLDDLCAVELKGAVKLDFNMRASYMPNREDWRGIANKTALAKAAFKDVAASLRTDSEDLVVRELSGGAGDVKYYMLLNSSVDRSICPEIEFAGGAESVKDFYAGTKALPQSRRLKFELDAGASRLFAVGSSAADRVEFDAPAGAGLGSTMKLKGRLVDSAGRPVKGLAPLRLKIFNPSGVESEYGASVLVRDGVFKHDFDIAENDAQGIWRIVAEDPVDGKSALMELAVGVQETKPTCGSFMPSDSTPKFLWSLVSSEFKDGSCERNVRLDIVNPGASPLRGDLVLDAQAMELLQDSGVLKGVVAAPGATTRLGLVFKAGKERAGMRWCEGRFETKGGTYALPLLELFMRMSSERQTGTAYFTDVPMKIDGSLSKWPVYGRMIMRNFTPYGGGRSGAPAASDLSSWGSLLYDADFLYFSAEVIDDKHVQNKTGAGLWANDSIQLAFSFDRQFARRTARSSSDYDFVMALTPEGPKLHQSYPADGRTADVKLAIVRNAGRTVYQVAFPWTMFDCGKVKEGDSIGFSWTVNESDLGSFEGSYQWGGGIIGWRNVSEEGLVTFERYVP